MLKLKNYSILCSTLYLLCSFDPHLYSNMTTEFLSRCLYIPAHPAIHIVLRRCVDQFPIFRAPLPVSMGFIKSVLFYSVSC